MGGGNRGKRQVKRKELKGRVNSELGKQGKEACEVKRG